MPSLPSLAAVSRPASLSSLAGFATAQSSPLDASSSRSASRPASPPLRANPSGGSLSSSLSRSPSVATLYALFAALTGAQDRPSEEDAQELTRHEGGTSGLSLAAASERELDSKPSKALPPPAFPSSSSFSSFSSSSPPASSATSRRALPIATAAIAGAAQVACGGTFGAFLALAVITLAAAKMVKDANQAWRRAEDAQRQQPLLLLGRTQEEDESVEKASL